MTVELGALTLTRAGRFSAWDAITCYMGVNVGVEELACDILKLYIESPAAELLFRRSG
jgi:hypothetical protein